MIINVAQLLKSDVGTTRYVDVNETLPPLSDGIQLAQPVRGTAELIRTNRGILVRARFNTAVWLDCSRCLETFVAPLELAFTEEYIPVVDVNTGAPTNIPRESYTYVINERHEVDLGEAVREYGLLELPMKPLCDANCAGLCPHCGTNRNLGSCSCPNEAADERFTVLKSLLSREIEK